MLRLIRRVPWPHKEVREVGGGPDIFSLLVEAEEKKRRSVREEVLGALGIEDLFARGSIHIDMQKCYGPQCDLCVKACPTSAIYWRGGRLIVQEEICIYCTACVLNCMIEGCIRVRRVRPDGRVEEYSSPRDVVCLQRAIAGLKAAEAVGRLFPSPEEFIRRYGPWPR